MVRHSNQQSSDGDRLLKVEELAQILQVSVSWVYSHASELGGFKLSGTLQCCANRNQLVVNAYERADQDARAV